jgi:hypothetical protein
VGYPMIAFLMKIGKIDYNHKIADVFKDIHWKDLNTKLKNDYSKTEAFILEIAEKKGISSIEVKQEVDKIFAQIKLLELEQLLPKIKPPIGY